jgi:hypothetical protein
MGILFPAMGVLPGAWTLAAAFFNYIYWDLPFIFQDKV